VHPSRGSASAAHSSADPTVPCQDGRHHAERADAHEHINSAGGVCLLLSAFNAKVAISALRARRLSCPTASRAYLERRQGLFAARRASPTSCGWSPPAPRARGSSVPTQGAHRRTTRPSTAARSGQLHPSSDASGWHFPPECSRRRWARDAVWHHDSSTAGARALRLRGRPRVVHRLCLSVSVRRPGVDSDCRAARRTTTRRGVDPGWQGRRPPQGSGKCAGVRVALTSDLGSAWNASPASKA
jgi:hypothetical protein